MSGMKPVAHRNVKNRTVRQPVMIKSGLVSGDSFVAGHDLSRLWEKSARNMKGKMIFVIFVMICSKI